MSTHRRSRIDRGAAERLLTGAAAHPQDGPDELRRLLAGMRAGAHPDELVSEEAAMAAYRAANLGPVPRPRRRSMLAKLLTLKIAAVAAVAITATGGVALAASAGVLPNPMGGGAPAAKPSAHPTGKPSTAGAKKEGASPASPSPSMVGLCRAYAAGVGDNPGKALENPAFQALIRNAGGKEQVPGYCDDVLAAHEAARGAAGKAPTARPSKAPGTHPSAGPENHPGAPATKPTGGTGSRPTAEPATRHTP